MSRNKRPDRLYILQFGAERVGKSLSVPGAGPAPFWAPFIGVLVESAAGLILFDTGMSRANLESAAVESVYRPDPPSEPDPPFQLWSPAPPLQGKSTWGLSEDPLASALAGVGFALADLSLAVISHLHWDHSGGITSLAAANVPVAVHRNELAFARSGAAAFEEGFSQPDWTAPGVRWQQLDEDTELLPGVMAVTTPGHTPGHLSFTVSMPATGTWIFAGDAADLGQNFLDRLPCGYCAGGGTDQIRQAERSLDRLLTLADRPDTRLIPGHDPLILNAIRHPLGGHR